jgi:hypothetical protein
MASAYRREPLIPATRMTAATNLAILRTQAASRKRPLTAEQAAAAVRMAMQLERVLSDYERKRTLP